MLTGKRAAVADDKVRRFLYESTVLGNPFVRLQVEVEPGMHAGVAEVSVERAFVAELRHHLAQVAEISAQLFGTDCGVFPTFPVERLAGHV